MTDRRTEGGGPFDADDPPRDVRLGAMLRDVVGTPPAEEVDWTALANRIGVAVRASRPAPWWSYADRWQRRVLPLAVAAGLVGALTIWGTGSSTRAEAATVVGSADVVSSVITGGSSADAALTFARSVASAGDLGAGAPE